MKKKWSAGKVAAVILGGTAAGMILLVTLALGMWNIARGNLFFGIVRDSGARYRVERQARMEERVRERAENDTDSYEEDSQEPSTGESAGEQPYSEEDQEPYAADTEYYEFHNALRDDLSYQAEFEYYGDLPEDNISVQIDYPVISGDQQEDFSGVNRAIQKELDEIKEYAESVSQWLPQESSFYFEAESYITYMDEEVLSIIYLERGYLDSEVYETYVVSVNIDMESKMAFTNSQMLDIDDEFSIEFRNRCERQNGEISEFSLFSDQDITDMLTDDDSLIIFYTPLGMEVGFNYYYGWVTVTYKDYQKYQSHF